MTACKELGWRSLKEFFAGMDATEALWWVAYFETGGDQIDDQNVAKLRSTLATAGGLVHVDTKEPMTYLDYLPDYMKPDAPVLDEKAEAIARAKRIEATFRAMAAQMAG